MFLWKHWDWWSEKFQLLPLQISQAAARHRHFLCSEDSYTNLSTVRPKLTERKGNTETGCKHKPRKHFTKLEVTESNLEGMHQVALSRVLCPGKKFLELQKWLGKQWVLHKILTPSGDSMGKLVKYIQCSLLKLSLRPWQFVILRYSRT